MVTKETLQKKLFTLVGLATRAMSLGVRGIVTDDEGKVLLVRHTYVAGWHFPGGAVERGETLHDAIEKEIREETMIRLTGRPELFHFYKNPRTSRFDHVALFLCSEWEQISPFVPNREIAETSFFAPGALPDEATDATRARLNEVLGGEVPADIW